MFAPPKGGGKAPLRPAGGAQVTATSTTTTTKTAAAVPATANGQRRMSAERGGPRTSSASNEKSAPLTKTSSSSLFAKRLNGLREACATPPTSDQNSTKVNASKTATGSPMSDGQPSPAPAPAPEPAPKRSSVGGTVLAMLGGSSSTRAKAPPTPASTTAPKPAPKPQPSARSIPEPSSSRKTIVSVSAPPPKSTPAPSDAAPVAVVPTLVRTVPAYTPFPSHVTAAQEKLLRGAKREMPYTVPDIDKSFYSEGVYACVRCRNTIARAVDKVPLGNGVGGFQDLIADHSQIKLSLHIETGVSCFESEGGMAALLVYCASCDGFLGNQTQQIPNSALPFVSTGNVYFMNLSCLHVIPEGSSSSVNPSSSTSSAVSGKKTTTTTNAKATMPATSKTTTTVTSNKTATTVSNKPPAMVENHNTEEEDDDDELDLLCETDFDDLDVIGTVDGAANALARRKQLHQSWRSTPTVHKAVPKAVGEGGVAVGAAVSYEQRHGLRTEALNEYSSESEVDDDEEYEEEEEQ